MLLVVTISQAACIFFIFSICSAEMSRDLAGEVERLMKAGNSYVKKKVVVSLVGVTDKMKYRVSPKI